MIIEVTDKNIAEGSLRSACYCPIALAVKDKVGHEMYVSVYYSIYVGTNSTQDTFIHSKKVTDDIFEWIQKFDRGEEVESFSFDFDKLENC